MDPTSSYSLSPRAGHQPSEIDYKTYASDRQQQTYFCGYVAGDRRGFILFFNGAEKIRDVLSVLRKEFGFNPTKDIKIFAAGYIVVPDVEQYHQLEVEGAKNFQLIESVNELIRFNLEKTGSGQTQILVSFS